MAKYFMGSVGEARAEEVIVDEFTGQVLETRLAFTSKTLTDSAVNVSIQKEDIIDSYNGAPAGVFYHSPNVNITLSDVLWQPEFLECALGQSFSEMAEEGSTEYATIKITSNVNGTATITSDYPTPRPVDFPGMPTGENEYYLVIGKRLGEEEWYEFPCRKNGNNYIIGESDDAPTGRTGTLVPNTVYCFRYLTASLRSRELLVTTKIIPKELRLTITTPLFLAQGGCEDSGISKSTHSGYIVYEVPRWALNADLSLSATMSGTQGMQLVGNVLEAIDNEEGSPMMRIKEFIPARAWWEGLAELYWDGSFTSTSSTWTYKGIYGIYADGSCKVITSTTSDIRLAFEGVRTISNQNNLRQIGGTWYNVTGVLQGSPTSYNVTVYPVIEQVDEETGQTSLFVLDSISCNVNYDG